MSQKPSIICPIQCPNCSSKNTVKKGIRKNKLQSFQQYQCKSCKRIFKQNPSKNKTYSTNLILKCISQYNLGYSLCQLKKRVKTEASLPTISNWINQYKGFCTFHKLRNQAKSLHTPETIIDRYTLLHNNLPYNFQIHQAKLHILFHNKLYNNQFTSIDKFQKPLTQYLNKIPTEKFPHRIFKEYKPQSSPNTEIAQNKTNGNKNDNERRASQLKFSHLKITKLQKTNLANKLTQLALNLATKNKQRHQAIQNFFLINDSTTIATEIPVYLTNWDAGYYRNQRGFIFPLNNYKTPLTGHIDILQIRNGLLHILDYKPEAEKQQPIEQLTLYALALSRKLNLELYHFKAAWFDQNNYYEFFPLHAVYPKER